jgi:hypothetical protein
MQAQKRFHWKAWAATGAQTQSLVGAHCIKQTLTNERGRGITLPPI